MDMNQPQLFDLSAPMRSLATRPGRQMTAPRWHYTDVEAFVHGFIAPIFLVRLPADPNRTWCEKWWAHAEANLRLTVCWHAWEDARTHKEKAPDMWRELDYQIDVLWSPGGPFRGCQLAQDSAGAIHRVDPPPTLETAPDGMWADSPPRQAKH